MPERYEEEIEEILQQSGTELGTYKKPSGPRLSIWRLVWLNVKRSLGGKAWSFSPGRVMLTAVSLLLVAMLIRAFVPGLVVPLALAGLLLFIVAYGMFFIQPKGMEKRWRGQPIDSPRNSWWDRIKRRLK